MFKYLLIALLIIAVFLLWWSGGFNLITDMERLRGFVNNAGAMGPFLFILLMLLLFPLFAAGPLIWISPAIWPVPLAILYSSLGSILCGIFFFAVTRWWGRGWADSKVPDKVRKYEQKLEMMPWRTIIVLRAVLWVNPAVDALIGLSHVSMRTYILASTISLVPLTITHIIVVVYGADFASSLPAWLYYVAAGCIAALLARKVWSRKFRRLQ